MTTVLIAQTDTSCLHCVVHTMIKSYLEANPEFTRDEVVSCLMAVTAEFMVAALESIPTSGRTQ